ncbi:hypothetical protein HMPREF1432_01504 [Helicobacter pylori GAMchJs114i]|nr:hypothetical protein HMPREF1432_01504 [Helicobacter pylori GAMchJs114i]
METIEWNEEQRKAFQDLLREFVASIDAKAQERRQTGKTPKIPKYASCQNGLNKFLAPWGYACKISLGSGNLSHEPSIAFCRQDILGEGFVNGEKPTPNKRFLPLVCLLLAQEGCRKDFSLHRSIHRGEWGKRVSKMLGV